MILSNLSSALSLLFPALSFNAICSDNLSNSVLMSVMAAEKECLMSSAISVITAYVRGGSLLLLPLVESSYAGREISSFSMSSPSFTL